MNNTNLDKVRLYIMLWADAHPADAKDYNDNFDVYRFLAFYQALDCANISFREKIEFFHAVLKGDMNLNAELIAEEFMEAASEGNVDHIMVRFFA